MGKSPQELEAARIEAKTLFEQAKLDFSQHCEVMRVCLRDQSHKEIANKLKALSSSLAIRQERWKKFRRLISSRARIQFSYLLSERDFRGQLLIDPVAKQLDIKVEPDITKTSDKGRQTKTLSGGEKSFSTICLLLSLWEAMGSPIRCLDEL
jgi:structural maintenance of chromosomes protein 6